MIKRIGDAELAYLIEGWAANCTPFPWDEDRLHPAFVSNCRDTVTALCELRDRRAAEAVARDDMAALRRVSSGVIALLTGAAILAALVLL